MSGDSHDKAPGAGQDGSDNASKKVPDAAAAASGGSNTTAQPVGAANVDGGSGVTNKDGVTPLRDVMASGAAGDTAAWPAMDKATLLAAIAEAERTEAMAAAPARPPVPVGPPRPVEPPPLTAAKPVRATPPPPSPPLPPLPRRPLTAPVPAPPTAPLAVPDDGGDEPPPPTSVPVPLPFAPIKIVPAPSVSEVDVQEGTVLGDTRITLHGDNLLRYTIVRFGGELARPIGAREPHQLTVLTPPGKRAREVTITVQNPGSDEALLQQRFRYIPLPPPSIESVAPVRVGVDGGAEMTIAGANFVRASVVLVNGEVVGDSTFVDTKTIDFRAPPGTEGKTVDVAVKNPDGRVAEARRAFAYDRRY